MSLHRSIALGVAAILLLATAPARLGAAEVYVGAGPGADFDGGALRHGLEASTRSRGETYKVVVGATIGEHLAVEGSWYELGEQICCRGFADFGFATRTDGVAASVLGRRTLGRWTPFVKAGLLSWSEEGDLLTFIGPLPTSDDGVDPLVGVGIELRLGAHLRARGEWEWLRFGDARSDGGWLLIVWAF